MPVNISCLMLYSPSDQFRSRFHKVIATIPNIIADVKFLNTRTIKKESRECVIPCLMFQSLLNQYSSRFRNEIKHFTTFNLSMSKAEVEHFDSALRIIKRPEFEIYRVLPSVINKLYPEIWLSIGFPEISLDKSEFDLPNRFSVY